MKTDSNQPASRLARQLAIMGLSEEKLSDAELAAEAGFMEKMNPRELVLGEASPIPKSKLPWLALPTLVACAALAFFFLKPAAEDDSWLVKGASSVSFFAEQKGQISKLSPANNLESGTRIKAELMAGRPTLAFWGVRSRDGKLLTDAGWIEQNQLNLGAGEKKSFSGSLELEGASEGETLCVVDCPQSIQQKKEGKALVAEIAEFIRRKEIPSGDFQVCRMNCSALRP